MGRLYVGSVRFPTRWSRTNRKQFNWKSSSYDGVQTNTPIVSSTVWSVTFNDCSDYSDTYVGTVVVYYTSGIYNANATMDSAIIYRSLKNGKRSLKFIVDPKIHGIETSWKHGDVDGTRESTRLRLAAVDWFGYRSNVLLKTTVNR